MFMTRGTRKIAQDVLDLKRDVERLREDLESSLGSTEARLGAIEDSLGNLKSFLEDALGEEAGGKTGEGDWVKTDQFERGLVELREDISSLGEDTGEIRRRTEGVKEGITSILDWTTQIKKEFQSLREAIGDAAVDIKNKISYVVFRLKT